MVYDPVGGCATETCFRSLRWNGCLLVVDFAAGKIPRLPLNLALLKSASAVGVFWGDFVERYPRENRANLVQLKEWCEQGLIHPHVDWVFSFDQAPAAIAYLADRQVLGRSAWFPNQSRPATSPAEKLKAKPHPSREPPEARSPRGFPSPNTSYPPFTQVRTPLYNSMPDIVSAGRSTPAQVGPQ